MSTNGTRIRVAGEGEAGVREPLRRSLPVRPFEAHAIFERDGTTLIAEAPISFTAAALGGCITIPGIDGEKIELKIPAGIQSGETLRHRGGGMSVLNGRGRGDLVTRILVETPTKLSKEQRAILEQFRDTETGDECPASKGFFSRITGDSGRLGLPATARHARDEAFREQMAYGSPLGAAAARGMVQGMDRADQFPIDP